MPVKPFTPPRSTFRDLERRRRSPFDRRAEDEDPFAIVDVDFSDEPDDPLSEAMSDFFLNDTRTKPIEPFMRRKDPNPNPWDVESVSFDEEPDEDPVTARRLSSPVGSLRDAPLMNIDGTLADRIPQFKPTPRMEIPPEDPLAAPPLDPSVRRLEEMRQNRQVGRKPVGRVAPMPPEVPTSPYDVVSVEFDTPQTDRIAGRDQTWSEKAAGEVRTGANAFARAIIFGLPEVMIGVANLAAYNPALGNFGLAGKVFEDKVLNLKLAREDFAKLYPDSSDFQDQKARVEKEKNFIKKSIVVLSEPSMTVNAIAESIPLMIAGGLIGRGVAAGATKIPGLSASASERFAAFMARNAGPIGEGAVTTGSSSESIRQQTDTGFLTGGQAALAGLSGAGTTLVGAIGRKIAGRLGIEDIDSLVAGAALNPKAKTGLVKRVIAGIITEGSEELFQSVPEQVWSNVALGKPWTEGVDEAAIMGLITGGVMGGGANLPGPIKGTTAAEQRLRDLQKIDRLRGPRGIPIGTPPVAPPAPPVAPATPPVVPPPAPPGTGPTAPVVPPVAGARPFEEVKAEQQATYATIRLLEDRLKETTSEGRRDGLQLELTNIRRRYEDAYQELDNAGIASLPLRKMVEAQEPPPAPEERKYSSTQFDLPEPIAERVLAIGRNIPDIDLAEDGRETQPHLTIKWGLETDDAEEVRAILGKVKPFTVKLGRTAIFPNGESESGDVLKVNVSSGALMNLNAQIAKALKNADARPEYKPHVTIAYLKPGKGKAYVGDTSLLGTEILIDQITFSGKDGTTKVSIPLGTETSIEPTAAPPLPVPQGPQVPGIPDEPVAPPAPIPVPAPAPAPQPVAPPPSTEPVGIGRVTLAQIPPPIRATLGIGKLYGDLSDAELGALTQWSVGAMANQNRAIAGDGDRVNQEAENEIARRGKPPEYFFAQAEEAARPAPAPVAEPVPEPVAAPAPAPVPQTPAAPQTAEEKKAEIIRRLQEKQRAKASETPAAPPETTPVVPETEQPVVETKPAEPETPKGPIVLGPAPTKKPTQFKEIGTNALGQTLYENEYGVRSTVENGVRRAEPVLMIPTKGGVQIGVDRSREDRAQEWEPVQSPEQNQAPEVEVEEGRDEERNDMINTVRALLPPASIYGASVEDRLYGPQNKQERMNIASVLKMPGYTQKKPVGIGELMTALYQAFGVTGDSPIARSRALDAILLVSDQEETQDEDDRTPEELIKDASTTQERLDAAMAAQRERQGLSDDTAENLALQLGLMISTIQLSREDPKFIGAFLDAQTPDSLAKDLAILNDARADVAEAITARDEARDENTDIIDLRERLQDRDLLALEELFRRSLLVKSGQQSIFDAPEEEAPPAKAPTKKEQAQSAIDAERVANKAKRDAAVAKLKDKLRNQIHSGIDPEMVGLVVEIIDTYIKDGILKFKEAALAFQNDMPNARDFDEVFETAWAVSTGEEGQSVTAALGERKIGEESDAKPQRDDDGNRPAEPGDTGGPAVGDRDANAPDVEGAEPARPEGPRGSQDETASGDPGADTSARGPQEGAGPESGGDAVVGSGSGDRPAAVEAGAPDTEQEVAVAAARAADPINFSITETSDLTEGGWKSKLNDNLDALDLLMTIEKENRPATADEQVVLARYIGWGHTELAPVVDPRQAEALSKAPDKAEARKHLESILTDAELRELGESTVNAHYSFSDLPRAMWRMAQRMGFQSGIVVEPAIGTGHFFGTMPKDIMHHPATRLMGIDKEPIAARIARQLYQSANVQIGPLQEAQAPMNYGDLIISNVPFGKIPIFDPKFLGHDRQIVTRSIHNYYFGKALDMVRPGGLVMFVTSRYTMDERNDSIRQYLRKHGKLVAAFRLPQETFQKTAGTSVVADVIILQKRQEGEVPSESEPAWMASNERSIKHDGWAEDVNTNEYFLAHPTHVLGAETMNGKIAPTSAPQYTVEATEKTGVTPAQWDAIVAAVPENILTPRTGPVPILAPNTMKGTKEGSFVMQDGVLHVYQDGALVKSELPGKQQHRVKGFIKVRDAHTAVLDANLTNAGDDVLKAAQKKLTAEYEAFERQFGLLNSPSNAKLIRYDPNGPRVLSLEFVTKTKDGKYIKTGLARIFDRRVIRPLVEPTSADTPMDALAISLSWRGGVDLPFMQGLLNKAVPDDELAGGLAGGIVYGVKLTEAVQALEDKARRADLLKALAGKIYQDAQTDQWVPADQYLSGDVVTKLAQAEARGEGFEANVAALREIQPKRLESDEFSAPFGAPYIPIDLYTRFIYETMAAHRVDLRLFNTNQTKSFAVDIVGGRHEFLPTFPQGMTQIDVQQWVSDTLNNKLPTIWIGTGDDRVPAQDETEQYRESIKQLREAWDGWWTSDRDATERLTQLHNELFNREVQETFDGSHLVFPNASADITLRFWQKNAIWRVLAGGNAGIFHAVGTGKTFIGAGIAGEWKRLGRANKIMITVPNPVIDQWKTAYELLYPTARILVPTAEDFKAANRRKFVSSIANNDWDVILIGHSQYTRVSVSTQALAAFTEEQVGLLIADGAEQTGNSIEDFEGIVEQIETDPRAKFRYMGSRGSFSDSTKDIVRAILRLRTRLAKRTNQDAKDAAVTFEELGIDALIVDEAHAFKNLYFTTGMNGVAGVKPSESDRAIDMFLKTRMINTASNNRNLVFLTGTPVTNTMTEVYTSFRYLAQGALERLGLGAFDAWAAAYTSATSRMEPSPGGGYRERTRLRAWRNLRELSKLFRRFADVLTTSQVRALRDENNKPVLQLPNMKNGRATVITTEPHPMFEAFRRDLVARIAAIKAGSPLKDGRDNSLWITTDAGKAAVDLRLVDPAVEEDPNGRIPTIAKEVEKRYKMPSLRTDGSMETKGTQLVFLDIGVPPPEDLEPLPDHVLNAPDEEIEEEDDEDTAAEEDEVDEGDEFLAATAQFSTLYADIRDKLIAQGVKKDEIAFIHQARDRSELKKLYAAVNAGRIRVLIATRAKGGIGVNVQNKVFAIHHADVPWRPDQLEQANGRGFRQGNENVEVEEIRYVTARTFDAFRWGLLAIKNNQITKFYRGELTSFDDVDTTQLDLEVAEAAATGDPRAMEMLELEQEVKGLKARESSFKKTQRRTKQELEELNQRYSAIERGTDRIVKAIRALNEWFGASGMTFYRTPESDLAMGDVGTTGSMVALTKEREERDGYILTKERKEPVLVDWSTKEGKAAFQDYIEKLFAGMPDMYGDTTIATIGPFSLAAARVKRTRSNPDGTAGKDTRGIGLTLSIDGANWRRTFPDWYIDDKEAPDYRRSLNFHLSAQKLEETIQRELGMMGRTREAINQAAAILSKSFGQADELAVKAWRLHILRVELGMSKLNEAQSIASKIHTLEQTLEDGSLDNEEYQKEVKGLWEVAIGKGIVDEVTEALNNYRRAWASRPVADVDDLVSQPSESEGLGEDEGTGSADSRQAPTARGAQLPPERPGDPHRPWTGSGFRPPQQGIIEGRAQPTNYVPQVTLPIEFPELVRLARLLHKGGVSLVKGFRKAGKMVEANSILGIRLHVDLFRRGNEQELAAAIAHEIGHVTDWLPHYMLRGNLLGRLLSLKEFRKGTFTEADGHTIKDAEIRKELILVSAVWRPWDPSTAPASFKRYRNSGEELYADAISMLFNDPGQLKRLAPKFYEAFFEHLYEKPAVRKAYFGLMDLFSQDDRTELVALRQESVERMSYEGDIKEREIQKGRLARARDRSRFVWDRVVGMLRNKNIPIIKMEKAVLKSGKTLEVKPSNLLSERNYLIGRIKAVVAREFQPIYDIVTEISQRPPEQAWAEFHSALFYDRIIEGDRDNVGNPDGIQPKEAEELRERLEASWTPAQRQILTQAKSSFRAFVRSIAVEAYQNGLISDENFDKILKNPAYATFRSLEHMEDSDPTFMIFKQRGMLDGTQNVADATIAKTLATILALEHNKVKVGVIDFIRENFPTQIAQAKEVRGPGGKLHVIEPPRHSNLVTVYYYDKGVRRGVNVDPYIAASLNNEIEGARLGLYISKALGNTFFRQIFTTISAGFQIANVFRDFGRFVKNLYAVHGDMGFGRAMLLYVQAKDIAGVRAFGLVDAETSTLRKVIRTLKGKPGTTPTKKERAAYEMLLDLEELQVLAVTLSDLASNTERDQEQTQIEETMVRYGAIKGTMARRAPGIQQFVELRTLAREFGDFIETLPKAAGGLYFAKKNAKATGGKMSMRSLDADRRAFIRESIGTPDALAGGTLKPVTNNLLLFSNIIVQGWASDMKIATNPKSAFRYWWKTVQINILPKVIMVALPAVAAAVAKAGGGGDDDEVPAWGKFYDNIPEYDKKNYIPVPRWPFFDKDGKSVYWRIPQDDTGRTIGALAWTMRTAWKESEGFKELVGHLTSLVLDYTGGQLPSTTPALGAVKDVFKMVTNQNVYDDYRNQMLFTPQEQSARATDPGPAWEKFLRYEFKELGGNVLSNPLDRFMKVSDQGKREALQKVANKARSVSDADSLKRTKVIKEKIQEALDAKTPPSVNAIAIDLVDTLYPDDTIKERRVHLGQLRSRVKLGLAKVQGDQILNVLTQGGPNAVKVEVLMAASRQMPRAEFLKWLQEAAGPDGVVSKDVKNAVLAELRKAK